MKLNLFLFNYHFELKHRGRASRSEYKIWRGILISEIINSLVESFSPLVSRFQKLSTDSWMENGVSVFQPETIRKRSGECSKFH